jgi:hypothetical protein
MLFKETLDYRALTFADEFFKKFGQTSSREMVFWIKY